MGKLSSAMSAPAAPAAPAPSGTAPGLKLRGINAGGVNMVDPNAEGQVAAATAAASTSARISAENAAKEKENADFLKTLDMAGKPLTEIGFEDLYKATGNLDLTKKFLDTRNAFQGKDTNQQKFVDASVGIITGLIDFAKKIPVSPGTDKASNIYGKQVQTRLNKVEAYLGSMPDYDAYQTIATLVSPMLVKAFGDSGNVPEQQIKMVGPALFNLASGSQALRESSKNILQVLFSQLQGKPVKFTATPATHKDLSTQDLIKMLGVQ